MIYEPILDDLDKNQFAVTGNSTEQALVYMLHLALEALDQGYCSIRFFFPTFVKGSISSDHRILMRKLCKFNIHNCLARWVTSFLQGRSQFTRIGNTSSSTRILCGGIRPQGTKLAPILFTMMATVNDLLSTCRARGGGGAGGEASAPPLFWKF